MKRLFAAAGLGAILAGAAASPAFADLVAMRDLLTQGYKVVSTVVIPQDVIRRAMANESWTDDLLYTLQLGPNVAFCHLPVLQAWTDVNILGYQCYVPPLAPQPAAPPPPADASSSSSAEPSLSQPEPQPQPAPSSASSQ
ncbi:MAG TPA: hypothetical protein VHZ56_05585 [Devosia sp.]|jgi:hypothetical protein|nr:hypothetical protein [Devosia sp.]